MVYFSTLGFYPVNPANGEYVLGIPQTENALIKLDNNKTLKIKKSDSNIKVSFNKKEIKTTIHHKEILEGGLLEFN